MCCPGIRKDARKLPCFFEENRYRILPSKHLDTYLQVSKDSNMNWLRMWESSSQVKRVSIIAVHGYTSERWDLSTVWPLSSKEFNLLIYFTSRPDGTSPRPHIHDIRENLPSKLDSTHFWRLPFQMQAPPPLSPEKRSGAGAGAGWDTWLPPGCSSGRCHAGHTTPPSPLPPHQHPPPRGPWKRPLVVSAGYGATSNQ